MEQLNTITAEELALQPLAPPNFLIEGLLPPGLSVLGGAGKVGKSWLVLWLAISATARRASRRSATGRRAIPRTSSTESWIR